MSYPDLHAHSTFSVFDGMGTPKQVVDRAVELGWGAACLTEHGWMGSAPSFYKACREAGIKPILGCELYVVPDEAQGQRSKEFRQSSFHLTALALSKEGYFNLVAWNTFSHQPENFYYRPRISLQSMVDVAPHSLHHNVILSGCLGGELCTLLKEGGSLEAAEVYLLAIRSVFPNVFVEVQNHAIEKFIGCGFDAYDKLVSDERLLRPYLIELAKRTDSPLILTNDSHFQSPKQRKSHIAMRASAWRHRDDSHYGQSGEQLAAGYMKDYAYFGNYLRNMEKALDGIPDQALESIIEIVNEANIKLDPLDSFDYSIPFSGRGDPIKAIRKRSRVRLEKIVRRHGSSARERFEFELRSMGEFAHYLLLLSDFIIHAKNEGILTNTRGSAANSILCYCLKIHDIDSIEYGLTFSRFFNPARKKLPDIDVDIEKDRFDDFMQYVHEKMKKLEGEGQVVQICNYGTQANRSAFRAAASALGVPKEEQDEISKLLPQMIDSGMVDEEADAYEILKESYPDIYEIASTIFDQVKSVGQHACGWLFGTEGRTIEEWIPMYLIASSGKLVTQYDLKSLDEFGLVKGDFLRLRSLSVIKRTMEMVGMNAFDLDEIPLDDEATYEMLREGKTEGVFTLQGKENRRGCMEVEVEDIEGIINTVAIYRPALTRIGKHTTYNKRRRGEEKIEYPHEIVEEILGPTHGVPIFQEQAMELAYAVGCSDAEVDDLYQAIKVAKGVGRGAKEAFSKIEPRFMKRALKIMDEDEAEGVWAYVKSFQGYGFNKGHATSYGLLGYRSAYLKCHHRAEFFTSLLDTYPEKSKYIAAARSEGFKFLLPCVNQSGSGFTLDLHADKIRVGLSRVKGLGPVAVREIIAGQPYTDLEDFKSRTSSRAVNKSRIEVLANVGALQSIGIPGDADDQTQIEILGFCIKKPKALVGKNPKYVNRRVSDSGWQHLGREKGVEITLGRASVSKLFWIPKDAKLELKASPWAQVQTWLLSVVDENGIAFQLMANEDKEFEVKALKFLNRRCQGAAVCVDGSVRQSFLTDGPQGFRFWGVSGAGIGKPQMWGVEKKFQDALVELSKMKWRLLHES